MKFNDVVHEVLNEKTISLFSNSTLAKKLRDYRGINAIVVGEHEPPDVHGIPKKLEAYGRGGFHKEDGSIWIDGGAMGSATGHPAFIENGFYWGADQDIIWTGSDGKKRKGVIYVRGRAGTDESLLATNLQEILGLIFKRLPR